MGKHKMPQIRGSKANGSTGKKTSLVKLGLFSGGFLLAVLVAIASLRSSASIDDSPSKDSLDSAGKYVRRETKSPLSPALFVGKTASAYQIAQEVPDVLDHLYCYCYCDKSIGHVSLLSCFADTHAANCGVCQNEAIDAAALLKKGSSLSEIRRQIDSKYGRI